MSAKHIKRVSNLEDLSPSHERRYSLMGEPLLFQTNDRRLIALADEAFGRFPPVEDPDQDPLVIRLYIQESADQERRADLAQSGKPIYHTQEHMFSIHMDMGNYAIAELKSGFAYGFITPQLVEDRDFIRINFVEALGLSMLGIARNFVVVHAACVVKEGMSILLHGEAGSGKSTLAFACLSRGYQVVAEDVVFGKMDNSAIRLWGSPWKFHLLPETAEFFPDLLAQGKLVQISGETKIELDLENLCPGSTLTNAPAGIIILLTRESSKPLHYERVARPEAMREFSVNWPWATGWNDRLEATSQRLLDGGVYRLNLNSTPAEAAALLDVLLEEVRDRRV